MSFDAVSKLDLFMDEHITNYKNVITNSDGNFVFKKNAIMVDGRKIEMPLVKNTTEHIETLKREKQSLLIEFHDMYNDIIACKHPEKKSNEYNTLVGKLNIIEGQIQQLYKYDQIVNDIIKSKISELEEKRKTLRINLGDSEKANDKKKYVSTFNILKKVEEDIFEYKRSIESARIGLYIDTLPEIHAKPSPVVAVAKSLTVSNTQPVKVDKKTKAKKIVGIKNITPQKMATIKQNVKELISKHLKSKNKEECVSKKHSQPYYMSLKNLLEEINNNPELKALLPSNYKSMTKEQICEILYVNDEKI